MSKRKICQSDFTIEFYDDLDVVLDCRVEVTDFSPERPAPACSNPSSPMFADDGDPMDYDIGPMILTVNGTEIEVDPVTVERILKAVDVRFNNKLHELAREAEQDAMMESYESRRDQNIFEDIFESFLKRRSI